MKRDIDLSREILLIIEEAPFTGDAIKIQIPDRPSQEIWYHIRLLHQAGLVEASKFGFTGGEMWTAFGLTNAGHDFLENARNKNIWEKAKTIVMEKWGILTIEAIKIVFEQMTKQALGQ